MDAIENMLTRRSVKCFDTERIPDQSIIDKITEVGTHAPTGMGKQSPVIVEITNKQVRDRLSVLNAEVLGAKVDPFYGAPVVLAVLADKAFRTYVYDGSLVMGNMLNAAHALGIGACWIHRAKEIFSSDEGKQMLADWGISGDYEGIGFCVLGYGIKEPKPALPRKENYVVKVK